MTVDFIIFIDVSFVVLSLRCTYTAKDGNNIKAFHLWDILCVCPCKT